MDTGKNYILSKESGNKVFIKNFFWYKITGIWFFIGFLLLGLFLIFANIGGTRYYLFGVILICIGLLSFLLLFPFNIRLIEHKDKFLIEKTKSFWIKSKTQIYKKEKPKILGVEVVNLGMKKYRRYYGLKISCSNKEIKLSNPSFSVGSEFSNPDLNTPEEIKEIAEFFNLSYKFK